jgi:hypothetical protein
MTTVEALKILVRSYLCHLQQHNPNAPQNKKNKSVEAEEPKRKVNANIAKTLECASCTLYFLAPP